MDTSMPMKNSILLVALSLGLLPSVLFAENCVRNPAELSAWSKNCTQAFRAAEDTKNVLGIGTKQSSIDNWTQAYCDNPPPCEYNTTTATCEFSGFGGSEGWQSICTSQARELKKISDEFTSQYCDHPPSCQVEQIKSKK